MKKQQPRILYSSGPVDATSVYMHWATGQDDPSHFVVIYAQQFYELCKLLDAKAYLISCRNKQGYIEDQNFKIRYRPIGYHNKNAFFFYFGQLWSGLRLIGSALRFRANVVIVTQDRTFWFLLSILPLLGIIVVPTIHCTLWPKHKKLSKIKQWVNKLDSWFFKYSCPGVCAVSQDIKDQVLEITGGQSKPIHVFIPTYKEYRFEGITPPDVNRELFRVLYVGRIERYKGVYQLLDIAQEITPKYPDIVFDLCGTGSDLATLQAEVQRLGLDASFYCHGYCKQDRLKQMYSESSIVVVPTMTDFAEGFNKVVLEGVLAGRPVITSSACPALESVREAVVEVTPDSMSEYRDAIIHLASDREFYAEKRRNALALQDKFFSYKQSWTTKVRQLLEPYGYTVVSHEAPEE